MPPSDKTEKKVDKKPNSVLFSLRELKTIQDTRKQQQVEDERRAQEEATERAKREEEARRLAEEDRARREQEERARREREERLRVEEAERRARIEAEMKLSEQRIVLEAEAAARLNTHRLRKTIVTISVVGAVVLGGLGYFLYQKSEETRRKDQEAAERLAEVEVLKQTVAKEQALFREQQVALEQKIDEAEKALLQANTEAERAAYRKVREETLRKQKELRDQQVASETAAKRREAQLTKKCDPSDPLCGI